MRCRWFLLKLLAVAVLLFVPNVAAQGGDNSNNNNSDERGQPPSPPSYVFAMVSKSLDNPFFRFSHQACEDKARALGAECLLVGTEQEDVTGIQQAQLIDQIVQEQRAHGIAVAVTERRVVGPAIDRAVAAGIPVVTFDSDAPNSSRLAYIGTDNYFFGGILAKVLKQLCPLGGTYAAISSQAPNLEERLQGFQDEIAKGGDLWTEVPGSPSNYQGNLTLVQEQLHAFAEQSSLTAIVPVSGAAMRSGGWEDFVNEHRHRNITLVSGDAMFNQLELLDRSYVQGLVGQLPYEMGAKSIQLLFDVVQGASATDQIIGTNVLSHILIPLELPELVVDNNLIGNLHIIGFILFGIIAVLANIALYWTVKTRHHPVVKSAQPSFLVMIVAGVFLMAASMIPLSFDDNGMPEEQGQRQGALTCMSIPWLGFCGFTLTFSALFSKTLRVNKIFHSQASFRRQSVSKTEILLPFIGLLMANLSLLAVWSIVDPLIYERQDLPGTDGWNRVIATYGSCQSDNVSWFLVPIAVVNVSALVLANWQAYGARNIMSEFSESRYIGLTMMSLMQACGIGVPVLFVVRESPQAFYLILVFMVFVICAATLLLIFVPKAVMAMEYDRRPLQGQPRMLQESVDGSVDRKKSSSSSSRRSPHVIADAYEQSSSTFCVDPPSDTSIRFKYTDEEMGRSGSSPQKQADSILRTRNSASGESKKVSWSEGDVDSGRSRSSDSSSADPPTSSLPGDHQGVLDSEAGQSIDSSFVDQQAHFLSGEHKEQGDPDSGESWGNSSSGNQPVHYSSNEFMGHDQEEGGNKRNTLTESDDDSTIEGIGTFSLVSDSETTGSLTAGFRSSGASLRSSWASLRSSGFMASSSEAERNRYQDDDNHSPAVQFIRGEAGFPNLDDLPPLMSCTENDDSLNNDFSVGTSHDDSATHTDAESLTIRGCCEEKREEEEVALPRQSPIPEVDAPEPLFPATQPAGLTPIEELKESTDALLAPKPAPCEFPSHMEPTMTNLQEVMKNNY